VSFLVLLFLFSFPFFLIIFIRNKQETRRWVLFGSSSLFSLESQLGGFIYISFQSASLVLKWPCMAFFHVQSPRSGWRCIPPSYLSLIPPRVIVTWSGRLNSISSYLKNYYIVICFCLSFSRASLFFHAFTYWEWIWWVGVTLICSVAYASVKGRKKSWEGKWNERERESWCVWLFVGSNEIFKQEAEAVISSFSYTYMLPAL